MLRMGIVIVVAGLLMADPILCRTASEASSCTGMCRVPHLPVPAEPAPVDPCRDAGHGCVCQGATVDPDTQAAQGTVSSCAVIPTAGPALTPPAARPLRPLPLRVSRSPASGRAICIACQSFLT